TTTSNYTLSLHDALPISQDLIQQIKGGKVNLDDPATTLALLKANAVVGVTGFFDQQGKLRSMGIQCAICHSTVDDSVAPGIGQRSEEHTSELQSPYDLVC